MAADFSIIVQSPQVRAIVQQDYLTRAFQDGLVPRMMFRGEASPVVWDAGEGDSKIFTATGLIEPDMEPLAPDTDPTPQSYPSEQWEATMLPYGGTIDTNMPTDYAAIASLFLQNAQKIGIQAAMSMNRNVRNRLYNAAEAGWSVSDGAQSGVTTLRVKRLNGFTRARNPTTDGASQVRYGQVSSANPLTVVIETTTTPATRTVTGYTPDNPGDEIGPGTLTLTGGAVTVNDRGYIYSSDRTNLVRSGGGNSVNDVGINDLPRLSDIRAMLASFRGNNVPEHADGYFHAHLDEISEALIPEDPELQRLMTSLPDYYVMAKFAIGRLLGAVFLRNTECPNAKTIRGARGVATPVFQKKDPFAGELYSTGVSSGVPVHRILFTGQGCIFEYHADLAKLITDAGITGKVAEPRISNNGIMIDAERIQLLIRAPQDRMMNKVGTTWKFMGDWPTRTDGATGDSSRIKRIGLIMHGQGV